MKTILLPMIAAAALLAGPGLAAAQSDTPPSAENMQGPPNANGFGKDQGIEKQSPVIGNAGPNAKGDEEAPTAKNMKGPPNANGYGK